MKSKKYKRSNPYIKNWSHNDWETPDYIASFVASKLLPSDSIILEPGAGRGQIIKYLPKDARIYAYETNPARLAEGVKNYPHVIWYNASFLSSEQTGVRVVVANPPFDYGIEFLNKSLNSLDKDYPLARCLFLLPTDYFQSQYRYDCFSRMKAYIHHVYFFRGRIAYLREGVPCSRRQCYDALFDIRPGKNEGAVTLVSQFH